MLFWPEAGPWTGRYRSCLSHGVSRRRTWFGRQADFFLIRPRAGTVTATIAPTTALAGKCPWHIIRNPARPPPGVDKR